MSRELLRRSISFRGIIQGCPDHQWMLTDALLETTESQPADVTPRWKITSEVVNPENSEVESFQNHYVVHDLHTGWKTSASSASALAQKIRERFGSE